ncbi:MAG: HlyD family efflux transporter periplasmic adaptor subunit [Azospirillum sp.]|nr:HlyD family efflux transporter periplasmic adaptor subunit [Azospirillum sp.]
MDGGTPSSAAFSVFIQLEQAARQAATPEALRYTVVNDLRRLVSYRQAALIFGRPGEDQRIEAVSGVAVLEPDAPFVRWLGRVATRLAARDDATKLHPLAADAIDGLDQAEWRSWSAANVLWCPLKTRDDVPFGVLWLSRDEPWQSAEAVLVERIAGCYAHAWLALVGPPRRTGRRLRRRLWQLAAVLGLLAMAVPVRQSALAPAEVVAVAPLAVAAPIDGVIARFHVRPNQPVIAGQKLFDFDDTGLQSQALVAERTLGIAQAELRQATQGQMVDRRQAGQVALIEAQVKLRQAELDYSRSLLERVTVTAERGGVAVFTDENDWIGRPVVTGQRILQIADPAVTELRIEVPVRDAIALTPGADIEMFLDTDPLAALPASLTTASYEAEMTPSGVLSYRVRAAFSDGLTPPRLGLQGTAQIFAERVPLALYLFRRPMATLRQTLGR